mmetsp:Transcript_74257/g.240171  ORF Transcript_74257/g.240171 Transcript_74257/m.240171 type:complete len:145 (-) Transcript_74257:131-565(-)
MTAVVACLLSLAALPAARGLATTAAGPALLTAAQGAGGREVDEKIVAAAEDRGGWTPVMKIGEGAAPPVPAPPVRREAFTAFKNKLRSRLLEQRTRVRSRLIIEDSQWHSSNAVAAGSFFSLACSIVGGLVLVGCLMRFGIFIS